MRDWQIALMIIMCVIFVVGVMVLSFLIWRFGYWRRHNKRVADEGSHEDSYRQQNCVLQASETSAPTLYFLDFHRQLHTIDFGVDSTLGTEHELQTKMAAMCGLEQPDTLALVYYNALSEPIVLDLDRLLLRDEQFVARMQRTAERPLLLTRLTEVPVARGTISPRATVFGGAETAAFTRSNQVALNMNYKRAGGQSAPAQAAPVAVVASAAAVPVPLVGSQTPTRAPVTTAVQSPHQGGPARGQEYSTSSSSSVASVPTPVIFPLRAHITTATPVFIMAADYYFAPLPLTPGPPLTGVEPKLDAEVAVRLEAAMCGETPGGVVHITHGPLQGSHITVDPTRGVATLHRPGMVDVQLVRRSADVLRYTIDLANAAQWTVFDRPIFLPPGRWCVRAKATLEACQHSNTAAKVYTVDVA